MFNLKNFVLGKLQVTKPMTIEMTTEEWLALPKANLYYRYHNCVRGTVILQLKKHFYGSIDCAYIEIQQITNTKRPYNVRRVSNPTSTGALDDVINWLKIEAVKHDWDGIVVQNILNEFLAAALLKRGFVMIDDRFIWPAKTSKLMGEKFEIC